MECVENEFFYSLVRAHVEHRANAGSLKVARYWESGIAIFFGLH
jgi:hypothetical protein